LDYNAIESTQATALRMVKLRVLGQSRIGGISMAIWGIIKTTFIFFSFVFSP
jgi:hypothetical protein